VGGGSLIFLLPVACTVVIFDVSVEHRQLNRPSHEAGRMKPGGRAGGRSFAWPCLLFHADQYTHNLKLDTHVTGTTPLLTGTFCPSSDRCV